MEKKKAGIRSSLHRENSIVNSPAQPIPLFPVHTFKSICNLSAIKLSIAPGWLEHVGMYLFFTLWVSECVCLSVYRQSVMSCYPGLSCTVSLQEGPSNRHLNWGQIYWKSFCFVVNESFWEFTVDDCTVQTFWPLHCTVCVGHMSLFKINNAASNSTLKKKAQAETFLHGQTET